MKTASWAKQRSWWGTWALAATAMGGCTTLLGDYEPITNGGGGGGTTGTGTSAGGSTTTNSSGSTTSSAGTGASSASSGGGGATSASTTSSGGGGGMGGTGVLGTIGDPCATVGQLGCAGNAQQSKLICGAANTWQTNGTCDGATLCDATVNPGTCQAPAAGCEGQSPGAIVCQSLQRLRCGPDLVTTEAVDTCPYLCSAGQRTGECVPLTDKRCSGSTGNTPQTLRRHRHLAERTCVLVFVRRGCLRHSAELRRSRIDLRLRFRSHRELLRQPAGARGDVQEEL